MFSTQPVWTGETVGCVIASPLVAEHQTLFAGAATGVLVSTDAGHSWEPISPDPIACVETLAVSPLPGFSRSLFAGGPGGLHWSADNGASWQRQFAAHVHALITFSGRRGEQCLVAGTERDGVIRSDDGGLTWDSANPGLLDPTILALAVSPLHGGSRTVFAGTISGISISRNEGKAWRPGVVPEGESIVQCLAVSPRWSEDRSAFAGTEASGLLRTDNGGLTWQAVPEFAGRGVAAIDWVADDGNKSLVAVATGGQILLSTNAGQSWSQGAAVSGEIATLRLGFDRGAPFMLVGLYDQGLVLLA